MKFDPANYITHYMSQHIFVNYGPYGKWVNDSTKIKPLLRSWRNTLGDTTGLTRASVNKRLKHKTWKRK